MFSFSCIWERIDFCRYPRSWYTNHLMLHGLRKVLNLCHGYSLCQSNEVRVDALERPLQIRTHDIITSSPPSMMRKSIRPLWSYIFIYMIDCHYVSSHQKHVFWFHISKNKKNKNNSKIKSGCGIHYLCLHKSLLVVGACLGHCGSLSLHRDSHLWRWAISTTMKRTLLGRG